MQAPINKEDKSIKLIETHAHYNMKPFHSNRKELIINLRDQGIEKIVIPAISYESNFDMRMKFDTDPEYKGIIYYAAGIHPKYLCRTEWDSKYTRTERKELGIEPAIVPLLWDDNMDEHMREFLEDKHTVAVGETGLDYSVLHENEEMKRLQTEYFIRFIDYANAYKKPVVLHIRPFVEKDEDGNTICVNTDVFHDAADIIRSHPIQYGSVVHCYSFSKETAERFMDVGVNYFGIGGAIGDRASDEFIETIKWLPLETILIETDAPYQKFSQNDPAPVTSETLFKIIDRIAEIKDVSAGDVRRKTYENAKRFYRL